MADLAPGTQLAHYRLVDKLGEGGMGAVWRAVDTRLDREVAIKILPEQFAHDAERVARFEREAKLLATLNHPNIAAIYDLQQAEGVTFLAMELVPGEDLAEKIARGPLAVDEALALCTQIALALETAHDNGVIHRDLKPANVRVTPDGVAKVLDFGLAKAVEPGGSGEQSPTITSGSTALGAVIGSASYMSPEQARGHVVDRRADVWAFGAVLYECLTARRAFPGETITDTLAAVLTATPDPAALPGGLHPRVRELIERCLTKDLRERQRDIGDVRLELERVRAGELPLPPVAAGKSARRGVAAWMLLGVLAGVTLGIGVTRLLTPEAATAAQVTRLTFNLPDGYIARWAELTPDGGHVVYDAKAETSEPGTPWTTFLRPLDRFEAREMPGMTRATQRRFSPDGRWMAYVGVESERSSRRVLFKRSLDDDGLPLQLVDWDSNWRGLLWATDGRLVTILDGTPRRLVTIAADGSGVIDEIEIMPPPMEGPLDPISVFPGGRALLATLTVFDESGYFHHVAAIDVDSGATHIVLEDASSPRWSPTGHLLFTRHDTLYAAPFDRRSFALTGPATAIESGLRAENVYGGAAFALGSDGTLMYIPGGVMGTRRRLATVAPDGTIEAWSTAERPISEGPVVAPDESHVAVTVINDRNFDEVWVADSGSRTLRLLVSVPGKDCDPLAFSADSTRLFYLCGDSTMQRIHERALDGSGEARLIVENDRSELRRFAAVRGVLPDGRLIYSLSGRGEGSGVWLLDPRLDPPQRTQLLDGQSSAWPSPDGRWLAYARNVSGQVELFVRRLADDGRLGPELPVPLDGMWRFWWAPTLDASGRPQLRTIDGARVGAIRSVGSGGLSARRPSPWTHTQLERSRSRLAELRDGRILIVLAAEDEVPPRSGAVVRGFFTELERKLAREK